MPQAPQTLRVPGPSVFPGSECDQARRIPKTSGSPRPACPLAQRVPKPGSPATLPSFVYRLQQTRLSQPNIIPLHSSVSPPQPPNTPAPARESEVNRYFPDNVFARLAYRSSGPRASQERECLERLERLGRETDRLVEVARGATTPATNPGADPATFMYPASVMDLATGTDSATVRDWASVSDRTTATERTIVTDSTSGTDSTTGTDPAAGTEPATNL